jgi:hypothetical protein
MDCRSGFALSSLLACTAQPPDDTSFASGVSAGTTTTSATSAETTSTEEDTVAPSGSSDETGPDGPNLDVAAPDTGGPVEVAEVFGHTGNTLYRMDPETKEVIRVGAFTGVLSGSIIDIALDQDSNMYGAAFSALYSIDRDTAACTLVAEGSYPTSLSFVPAGTLDPDVEALVGYVDDEYIRIDTTTGEVTTIGMLSDGLASSGDIVSVIDGGTYLTVKGPGCDPGDCVVEVSPTTGDVIRNFGPMPYDEVFGLGFWGGIAYGFARNGSLFEIQFNDDDSVSTMSIPIPDTPNIEWFGAGSTTSAPPAAG